MKREDQINKLMQLKIQECKSVVPKNFDEILNFFRSKINVRYSLFADGQIVH